MAKANAAFTLEASGHDERRSDQRYTLRAPCLVADHEGAHECVIADMSIGGASLEGDLPLNEGQEVALAFDSLIGVLGEVVRVRDNGVNLKFTGGPDQRLFVMDWVSARLKASRRPVRR